MIKRSLVIINILIMCVLILSACGPSAQQPAVKNFDETSTMVPANTAPASNPASDGTIIDSAGIAVKIPDQVKKIIITCYGGATQELVVLNGKDLIVAQPDMKKFPQIIKMYSEFKGSPQVGTFDDINIEEILKIKPDIVIASVGSPKGNKAIQDAGIPVVQVLTGKATIEKLMNEFLMIGQLTNQKDQAQKLVDYWNQELTLVNDRLTKIPAEKRQRVYYMLGSTVHTNGSGQWGQYFISAAGGINVAEEIGEIRDIEIEQLIKWNPAVIILSGNEGKFIPIADVKNNTQLQNIDAVKNNQLYLAPVGAFWWDRPSPESVLGILWLAKTLYPDSFSDIDLNKEIKYFFKTFYQYDVTDEDVNGFLNPTK